MNALLVEQPEALATQRPKSTAANWLKVGLCFFCITPLETDQNNPSEATTRHVETKAPYLECKR